MPSPGSNIPSREEVPHPLRKLDREIERVSHGKGGQTPKDGTGQGVSHSEQAASKYTTEYNLTFKEGKITPKIESIYNLYLPRAQSRELP